MTGNFMDGTIRGKVQFGAAWWFNDQKDGIERHLVSIANMGMMAVFIGMLTDAASVFAFIRHEYFRRIIWPPLSKYGMNTETVGRQASNGSSTPIVIGLYLRDTV